jgi:hypothetical protein
MYRVSYSRGTGSAVVASIARPLPSRAHFDECRAAFVPGRVFGVSLEEVLRQEHYAAAMGCTVGSSSSSSSSSSGSTGGSSSTANGATNGVKSSSGTGSSSEAGCAIASFTCSTQPLAPAPAALRTAASTPQLIHRLLQV